MLSVLRITRAEFAKVFKKPTVYIMAFILAIVLVISLLTYSPVERTSRSVSVDGDNGGTVYSLFMSSSETGDTKKKFDDEYITPTNSKITFYRQLLDRETALNKTYDSFKKSYNNLSTTYKNDPNASNLTELLDVCQSQLQTILDTYGNFTAFTSQESLNNIIYYKKDTIRTTYYFESKAFDVKENGSDYTYAKLKSQHIPNLVSDATTPQSFINSIEINDYIKILDNMIKYGSNIVYNSLNEILVEMDNQKNIMIESSKNLSEASKLRMTESINNIKELSTDFKSLIDGLTSSNVIYVVHTTKDYTKFADYHEALLKDYNNIKNDPQEPLEIESKTAFKVKFTQTNYIGKFQEYLNTIEFITPNEEFVKLLESYKTTTETNQTKILLKINELKTETATDKILDEITNYMLLGETYQNIIDNEVLNEFSNTLTLSQMKDAKNIDLKNYNEYENKHTISQLAYQLNNNIYSNHIGGTFSLNQTITTKANMLDFTYYSLKLCTVLIIIFTVMMIANLITSETDSGTIKLLLIRPYRRSTILFGKILATFFFSLSFLTFAFVVSMVAGYFMFGAPIVSQVLVTFNAGKSFLISPISLILLHLLSCAGDILFYLIIALTVSVLFRSYIGAISTSLIIYLGSVVAGAMLSNTAIFAFLPFTNISWFRFFGGEILPSSSGLNAILSSPVHSYQNIWLSIGISVGFSIILSIITFISFKRRDF